MLADAHTRQHTHKGAHAEAVQDHSRELEALHFSSLLTLLAPVAMAGPATLFPFSPAG